MEFSRFHHFFGKNRRPECLQDPQSVLPSELAQAVLEFLEKRDLKCLRLASKDWNTLVIPLLFDPVYISLRKKDLEVFSKIAQAAHLAPNVDTIMFDTSQCCELRNHLDFMQFIVGQARDTRRWLGQNRKKHPIAKMEQCYMTAGRDVYKLEKILEYLQVKSYVESAFEAWQIIAKEERHTMDTDMFGSTLVRDLPLLRNLKHAVCDENDVVSSYGQILCCDGSQNNGALSGSAFARSWDPFYMRPNTKP